MEATMKHYTEAAMERAMKVQEVIMRAMAKKITWWQAAEILGISCRQMRRRRERYARHGYAGLFDGRRDKASPKRVPVQTIEEVLHLYQERYYDFNVKHFHEKLVEEHSITLSYTWSRARFKPPGWSSGYPSAARTVSAARVAPCRGCSCTLTPASTAGGHRRDTMI